MRGCSVHCADRRTAHAVIAGLVLLALVSTLSLPQISCDPGSSDRQVIFAPVTLPMANPLTTTDVQQIIDGASLAIDDLRLVVAVVDRQGRALGIWHRDAAANVADADINKAIAIARTAAFLSSSQGPLTSRTLEFISTHHFPATFADPQTFIGDDGTGSSVVPGNGIPLTGIPEQRITTGVGFTPQGPLWQIFSTNRGARLDSAAIPYIAGKDFARPLSVAYNGALEVSFDPSVAGPGLGYLPGGVPLYKPGVAGGAARLVGGIGCYIARTPLTSAEIAGMEFAAIRAASTANPPGFAFAPIPDEGGIFLVGVLLPYLEFTSLPQGFTAGTTAASAGEGTFRDVDANLAGIQSLLNGVDAPCGWLIGPAADPDGGTGLTAAEVQDLVNNCIRTANGTRAAIRLPVGTPTKMIIAISNRNGVTLGAYRMQDAPIFSLDVSVTKARNVAYFSSPSLVATEDIIPVDNPPPALAGSGGRPGAGIAITNRTLGFITQPTYPPGIETAGREGPFYRSLALFNALPSQFDRQGHQAAGPNQSGIVFFPGAAPLYRDFELIGGIGVSGDGVEEDDFVTAGGVTGSVPATGIGFEEPDLLRADQFMVSGLRIPYLKFPQLPGPGVTVGAPNDTCPNP